MKITRRAVVAIAVAAGSLMATAGAADAAGGKGVSVCSENSGDFSVGTAVSAFAHAGAFSSQGNPGRPYPVVPIGVEGNWGCNPIKTQN
jgi:hypothetical protein